MDQDGVRARGFVFAGARQRFLFAGARNQRLGPGDHAEIRVAARAAGRFDLALELHDPHQFLPAGGTQAGVLGKGLVLHHHRRYAGGFVLRHHIGNVDRIAEPSVDIGNDGRLHRRCDRPHHVQVLRWRENIGVGHGVARRQFEAAAPDRVEPGLGREFGGQRVVRRHGVHQGGILQFLAKTGVSIHGGNVGVNPARRAPAPAIVAPIPVSPGRQPASPPRRDFMACPMAASTSSAISLAAIGSSSLSSRWICAA